MKSPKMNQDNMNYKQLNKELRKLIPLSPNTARFSYGIESGIIYTLYSDKSNLIEIGFAQNNKILENKLFKNEFILLDKKKGKKKELNLLIKTLNELNVKFSDNLIFKYSDTLLKHLSILGWPVGRSLYKQRTIKKEFSYA